MDKGVEKGKRLEEGENSMNQIIEEFFAKENGNGESGEDLIKSGFVSIVGLPNAGKSTLLNALVGQKIAITSKKAQTTRNQIMAVYDDERGQIVFHDTPGIHKAQNKLSVYMESVAERHSETETLSFGLLTAPNRRERRRSRFCLSFPTVRGRFFLS